jgi:septal ring factor EnvC (AmiA/AmiB activator)
MSSLRPKEGGSEPPVKPPSAQTSWILPAVGGAVLAVLIVVIVGVAYTQTSSKAEVDARLSALEDHLKTNADRIGQIDKAATQIAADVAVVTKRIGVTSQELDQSRKFAEQLRQSQDKVRQEEDKAREDLAKQLDAKASAADIAAAREEAAAKISQAQKDSDSKIGNVAGDVKTVANNLESTRQDLAASRREITDVRTTLSAQIARNSSELSDLRKKGERDYIEFDITKGKKNVMTRVADIQLELRGTDTKKQKFDIVMMADDKPIEKKDLAVNQPLQFLVGRDKLRYEIVVNTVDKDHIKGYLSTPKDKLLAAERPAFRE